MSRTRILWSLLALAVVAELYGFWGVRTALDLTAPAARRGFAVSYWLLTLGVYGAAFWAASTRHTGNLTLKSLLVVVPMVLLVAKLVVLLPLLLEDVTRLARWIGRGASGSPADGPPIARSEFVSRLALLLGLVPLAAMAWGVARGKTDYQVRRRTLRYPNLPPEFDGFKIVQISDLHTGSFDGNLKPLQRAVALINRQQADLVVMTGDLVNNVATEVEPHMATLAGIVSRHGYPVFSILGNHDYGDYVAEFRQDRQLWRANLDRLIGNHARMGWRLLLDESHIIRRGEAELAVLGVQNCSSHSNFRTYGNLAKAHAGSGSAPFKLLLSHDPSHWEQQVLPDYPDIDLMLAGHTHGMQFGINLPHFKWSPVKYSYPQWAGTYEHGRQRLYVNVGLGYLGVPMRVGFLPEITLIELRRA